MTVAEGIPSLRKPWTEVVAAKRAIREEHIKKPRDLSKTRRPVINFTELADIETLTKLYQSGQASVQEVITAYIDKACDAHNKTNCLTEICFEDAMKQAKSLDASMVEYGALVGPLHGVPVSLKDQFDVEGFDSSLGYVGRAFAPATSDALLVSVLRQLGAVIIAKTNLPQSIMWCECENPLWGLTTHPLNPKFTSGGSSGGEGALLALNGSLIGWGTDIGGSIRIPSHMNGLWGLKPSSGRMSYQGVAVSTEGQQHVPSAVGPMARSLSSLSLVTKAVIGSESWKSDPQLPPLPWKENEFQTFSHRPLVIGVLLDDGVVKVHPPVERVLKETVAKLIDAGHEIVEWDASLHADCISIMDEYYTADGGEDIRQAVTEGGEPFLPHVQSLIDRAPPISVYEYWQLNKRKIAAQQAYHTMWNEKRSPTGRCVDVVLMPTMPHTAITHRSCRWVGYTKVFNILDYTALSFPAGKASKHDIALQGYEPRNPNDAWNWQRYDAEAMDGQHVGLQLVGRRFDEEKILGAATQVEQVLREA